MLAVTQPDILALQELSEPSAELLDNAITQTYPYHVSYSNGLSVYGRGLYSKWPIQSELLVFHLDRTMYLRAEIIFNEQLIVIYVAHPPAPTISSSAVRDEQINFIFQQSLKETSPLILVGDFNMSDWSQPYQQITSRYQDSFFVSGWGLAGTWPDFTTVDFPLNLLRPLTRIDYIFYDAHWVAIEANVWPDAMGSDHRPIMATLAFLNGA